MTGSTPPSSPSSTPSATSSITPSPSPSIWLKIIKWLFFNIIFALIPLIYRYLKLCVFNDDCKNLDFLYKEGELLLLSTAIFAEAIGELIHTEPHYKYIALVIMGFSFLVIVLNTNMLVDIEDFSNGGVVAMWSYSIYLTSIIIGISGKIMGKN